MRRRVRLAVGERLGIMRTIISLAVLLALLGPGQAPCCRAAETDGVALAIIYDTSGSMRDTVPDQNNKPTPKYLIANHALITVTRQIEAYVTNAPGGVARKVETGVFIFKGETARPVIPFGPFEPKAIEDWARHFARPDGNTPLGNALTMASQPVLRSSLSHKHVLVITDGMNTAGPKPEAVLPGILNQARQAGGSVSVHFIAFDADAKLFDPIKKLGATVVSASNENQLNTQLGFILQRKILLEDEEPKKP